MTKLNKAILLLVAVGLALIVVAQTIEGASVNDDHDDHPIRTNGDDPFKDRMRAKRAEGDDEETVKPRKRSKKHRPTTTTKSPARSTTLASKSTTPASKSTTPASKSTTPASKSTTPASKSTTPASMSTTPASKSTTPASKSTTPASKSTTKPPSHATSSTTTGPGGSTSTSTRTPTTKKSETVDPREENRIIFAAYSKIRQWKSWLDAHGKKTNNPDLAMRVKKAVDEIIATYVARRVVRPYYSDHAWGSQWNRPTRSGLGHLQIGLRR